jgi:hypothetical protein
MADQTPEQIIAGLVEIAVQQVGCPLPCMGHDETRETYRRILVAVLPTFQRMDRAEMVKGVRSALLENAVADGLSRDDMETRFAAIERRKAGA